jgi:hypothetical protein
MRRLLLLVVAGIAVISVLGGGGYAAYWFIAANAAQAAVANWVAARQAEGFEVATESVSVSGFPGRILVRINGLELAQPDHTLAWLWRTEALQISVSPTNSRHLLMRIGGKTSLAYHSETGEAAIAIRARGMAVQVLLNDDRTLQSIALETASLSLTDGAGGEPTTARRIQIHATWGDGPGVVPDATQFSVRFDSLLMPQHTRGPLGNTMEVFQANLELKGVISSTDLPVALAEWRDAEGAMIVQESQVRWGSLDMSGRGGFTLDDQLRPKGSANVQIRGYAITIDAFHAAGRLDDEERKSIESITNFIGQRGPMANIGLKLRAEDGLVYVGPVSLGTVQPIIPLPEPAG